MPMHPVASSTVDHVRRNHHILVPLLLAVLAASANIHGPVQHQLLISSVSWVCVCAGTLLWTGFGKSDLVRRRLSWLAGGFLAFSHICDRAACDKEGIWSMKVPMASTGIFFLERSLILNRASFLSLFSSYRRMTPFRNTSHYRPITRPSMP